MTKAGNSHARHALVEGAWAERAPAKGSRPLHRRLAQPSQVSQASSAQAQGRRCQRARTLIARGQHANQVVVARAPALRGCMWAMAPALPGTPADQPTAHAQPATPQVA
ncbi:MAG TPA: hypothetical protein VIH59_13430 [Candidatus Tectomicrobia bacterium]